MIFCYLFKLEIKKPRNNSFNKTTESLSPTNGTLLNDLIVPNKTRLLLMIARESYHCASTSHPWVSPLATKCCTCRIVEQKRLRKGSQLITACVFRPYHPSLQSILPTKWKFIDSNHQFSGALLAVSFRVLHVMKSPQVIRSRTIDPRSISGKQFHGLHCWKWIFSALGMKGFLP